MYIYEPFKVSETLRDPRPYGILCKVEQEGRRETRAVIAPYSNDWEAVSKLAETCTALQVCPEELLLMITDIGQS